ncbi:hypothetical protein PRZ48_004782 [Zasmidium cellare]|uniref:AB hydrolase-1 domain-containing protein n=1 Tax=Zasmidium cellare TaxID=395010 RepID=A0ABR0EQH5_ZASCE|nr:hypothetical protein PRZ48_004782 [Zasmidium cellare]
MDLAIVIVHGSWHTPQHYTLLTSALKSKGFANVQCPRLPSAVDKLPIPPNANLANDTLEIHQQVESLADAGHPILLILHSYGGVVGGNALNDLLWPQRQAANKPGGVVHLVYAAAFIIPANTSLLTPFDGNMVPWLDEDTVNGTIEHPDPREANYNDIKDDAKAQEWLDMCVLCPASVVRDETSSDPYEHIGKGVDATYLVCKGDTRLTMAAQEKMAELLGEKRVMMYCEAGHCPMITQPGILAEVVMEAWVRSREGLGLDRRVSQG